MPPAKRAPRPSAAVAGTDPTPEVSGVAKKVAAKRTAAVKAPAKRTPAKASAPAPTAAARKASGAAAQAVGSTAVRVGRAVGSVAAGVTSRAEHAADTAEKAVAQVRRSSTTPVKRTPRKANPRPATQVAPEVEAVAAAAAGAPAPAPDPAPAAAPAEAPAAAPEPEPTAAPIPPAPPTPEPPAAATAFRGDEDAGEIRERGRALRKQLRRQDLGAWTAAPDRPDPIDLISATNADRLPSLIPLRWTRLLESPFAYLRGAAAVMASDLAETPTSGLTAQICGDAHLANFGLFASRERQQVVDVNDFDESLVGPWEFDVKRLAASIVLAGRVAGVKDKACRSAVSDAVRVYREVVHALAAEPVLAAWTASLDGDLARQIGADNLRPVLRTVYGKGRRNSSGDAAQRMAAKHKDGGWRFKTDPPELTRLPESESRVVVATLEHYASTLPAAQRVLLHRFRPVDVALRVGGLGSIGLRTYAVLLQGNGDNDALILQVKEARQPTIGRWFGTADPDRHQGERIVAAQQLMQTASDPMLGWTRIEGRDFLVRQFREVKGSVDATRLKKNQIDDYGRLAGALLARAHCRSLDARLLSGYLGTGPQFDEAMVEFAVAYADQTERDHAALVKAAAAGRVPTI